MGIPGVPCLGVVLYDGMGFESSAAFDLTMLLEELGSNCISYFLNPVTDT